MKKHQGSCLCGEVEFEVTGEFAYFYFCHCNRCQKETGTAHGANLFCEKGELKWNLGENLVKNYQVPNTRFATAFCLNCGSKLPSEQEGNLVVVPAGSLDTPVETTPNAHIFWNSRACWEKNLEEVTRFDELPKVTKKDR